MEKAKQISKKRGNKQTNLKIMNHFSWKTIVVILVILLLFSIGMVYLFKPVAFRTGYIRIEKLLNPNPQSSYVQFPKEEIVGIDVSYYQGDIEWDKACFRIHPISNCMTKEESGIERKLDFVLAKATEGITIKDAQYENNFKGAHRKGITFGAYHFFSVSSDPLEQAQHFIETAHLEKGDFVPVLDVEYKGSLSKQELRNRVLTWLKTVSAHYGINPVIYTYSKFKEEIFDSQEFSEYKIWLAHYRVEEPTHECVIWQFTEDGIVYGIKGYVDINIYFGDKKSLSVFILK